MLLVSKSVGRGGTPGLVKYGAKGRCPYCVQLRPLGIRKNAKTCGDPACIIAHKRKAARARYKNPSMREKAKAAARQRYKIPAVRKKAKAAASARAAELLKDPVYRERRNAAQRERYKIPAVREKAKAADRERRKDPAVRERRRKYMAAYREKMRNHN